MLYQKKNDQGFLTAYYVANKDALISEVDLKNFLMSILPEYMIPSIFIELKEAILTINGKLDRTKLINADFKKYKNVNDEKTDSVLVDTLKKAWINLVPLSKIDSSTNFFEMGGDSITLVRFCKTLNDEGFKLNLTDFF